MSYHSRHVTGQDWKKFLRTEAGSERIIDFQQGLQLPFFLLQGLTRKSVIHSHGDEDGHARQETKLILPECIGLNGTQSKRADPALGSTKWKAAVGKHAPAVKEIE